MADRLFARYDDNVDDALLRASSEWELLSAKDEIALAQDMEAGDGAHQRLASGTSTDTVNDASLVRVGHRARDRLIASNIRLVYKHASRFRGAVGVDLADLVQDGVIGLIHAVDRFDWRRGHKFSSYASWWIRVYISRAHAETSKTIRTPLSVHVNIEKARSAVERLRNGAVPDPSIEQVAEESGLTPGEVAQALNLPRTVPSEIISTDGEPISLLELLEATDEDSRPEASAEQAVLRSELAAAIQRLSHDERIALALRSGFVDDRAWRYREIAEHLDLSAERVRQLCGSAIESLRENPKVARLEAY